MEWFRRLYVFKALLYEKSSLTSSEAFFLTAHFSQDDYPYDW